jgi:hypothetical protein
MLVDSEAGSKLKAKSLFRRFESSFICYYLYKVSEGNWKMISGQSGWESDYSETVVNRIIKAQMDKTPSVYAVKGTHYAQMPCLFRNPHFNDSPLCQLIAESMNIRDEASDSDYVVC